MLRSRLACALMFVAALAATAVAQTAPSAVFPATTAYTLSKVKVTLPADLRSDANLLLLYFRADQQPDVEAWVAVIDGWRNANPALGTYTSLVSPRMNILSRWWQNASLRSAFPDSRRWPVTLPLYVDRSAFLHALAIDSDKQVVLLVTDRQGRVVAHATGTATQQNRTAIHNALPAPGVAPGIRSQPRP